MVVAISIERLFVSFPFFDIHIICKRSYNNRITLHFLIVLIHPTIAHSFNHGYNARPALYSAYVIDLS